MKNLVLTLFIAVTSLIAQAQTTKTIVQLKDSTQDSFWYPLTDKIRFGDKGSTAFMSVDWEAGTGAFFGELKINQGAGFASYRTIIKVDLSDFKSIAIPVKGDGRKYKLLLKDKQARQSEEDYSYQAEFETEANQSRIVELNLADFKPVYRGKVDASRPEINASEIEEMGLQINDKFQGPYRLEFGEWQAQK